MDDRITKLMKLDANQLMEVKKVLHALSEQSDLDEKTFDNLMEVKDLTTQVHGGTTSKADLLVQAIRNIRTSENLLQATESI